MVDLAEQPITGEEAGQVNLLPSPRSPTDMPTGRSPAAGPITLRDGQQVSLGPQADADHEGLEYAPKYDPDLILLAFYSGNDVRNNWRPLELDPARRARGSPRSAA